MSRAIVGVGRWGEGEGGEFGRVTKQRLDTWLRSETDKQVKT